MKKSDNVGGKAFYDLWFIFEGKGASRGNVLKAWCGCKGGRDGGCKHISAAMYSLEYLLNTHSTDSVTSGPCQWVKRPTSFCKPCEVKDLKIGKCSSPPLKKQTRARSKPTVNRKPVKKRARKPEHTFSENIDMDVRNEINRSKSSAKSLEKFVLAISGKHVDKPPAIFPLLEKMYLLKLLSTVIFPVFLIEKLKK